MARRIFVCGSLRKGEINHTRFEGFGDRLVATGFVGGVLLKDLGSYPAMMPSGDLTDRVIGEVYEISATLGHVLDDFEASDGFFPRRVTVVTSSDPSQRLDAEAYFFSRPDELAARPNVAGGDWAAHEHARPPRQRA